MQHVLPDSHSVIIHLHSPTSMDVFLCFVCKIPVVINWMRSPLIRITFILAYGNGFFVSYQTSYGSTTSKPIMLQFISSLVEEIKHKNIGNIIILESIALVSLIEHSMKHVLKKRAAVILCFYFRPSWFVIVWAVSKISGVWRHTRCHAQPPLGIRWLTDDWVA
jgi:hypothetical protein